MTLCASLDPRHDSFDISKICTLVEKFYPEDFSSQERAQLESQLPHFQLDVCNNPELKCLSSLADLTVGLYKTGKAATYSMVVRLLRLVITLPVSTATAERAFSAMKLIKTRLRNRMGGDYLRHYMIVYIDQAPPPWKCSEFAPCLISATSLEPDVGLLGSDVILEKRRRSDGLSGVQ